MRELVVAWWRSTRAFFSVPDVVPQTPERNAMEFGFKAVLGLWLLPVAVGAELPRSLAESPGWMSRGAPWAVIIGAAISIVGLALRDRDNGIDLQQVGLILVGTGLLIYASAVVGSSTLTQSRFAAGVCFGLAFGAAGRWWQMQRYVLAKRREDARRPQ